MPRVRWPILCATLLASSPVFAQATGNDAATAQALFDDGKRLMQEGHYDEGCPKLVESQRLDPGGGTLLAIALCHEGQGKLATAWGHFNEALSEARKDHRADRESAAAEHIRALEAKMPRARIVVAKLVDGLEVRRDGAVVGSAQWGTALPIDPGVHRFQASAPGRQTWEMDVTVPAEARQIDVSIPELKAAPEVAPAGCLRANPRACSARREPPAARWERDAHVGDRHRGCRARVRGRRRGVRSLGELEVEQREGELPRRPVHRSERVAARGERGQRGGRLYGVLHGRRSGGRRVGGASRPLGERARVDGAASRVAARRSDQRALDRRQPVKRLRVIAAALVLAAGCRSVLGIESLEEVDGGTETDGGGVKDATLADASTDAADASVPRDAADASVPRDAADATPAPNPCAEAGPNCNMCCRGGSGQAEHLFEQYAVEAGCVCGQGWQCATQCADSGLLRRRSRHADDLRPVRRPRALGHIPTVRDRSGHVHRRSLVRAGPRVLEELPLIGPILLVWRRPTSRSSSRSSESGSPGGTWSSESCARAAWGLSQRGGIRSSIRKSRSSSCGRSSPRTPRSPRASSAKRASLRA